MLREKASEALDLSSSVIVKDQKIRDLEQAKGTLTAQISELRTDLGNLSEEHGECSKHLHTHLAAKDEKIRILQAEKTAVEEHPAETVAALRTKLEEKEKEVADLEEANGNVVAEPAADTVERLKKLNDELEVSRLAHAQCEEKSISHCSRIGHLLTAKEQLEEKLRDKKGEIGSLQRRSTEPVELQEKHAKSGLYSICCSAGAEDVMSDIRVRIFFRDFSIGPELPVFQTFHASRYFTVIAIHEQTVYIECTYRQLTQTQFQAPGEAMLIGSNQATHALME